MRSLRTYAERLRELDASLRGRGKEPIRLVPGDENLEDEDILEMVNAGLIGITVVKSYTARFWDRIWGS